MLSGNERGGIALLVVGVLAGLWIIVTADSPTLLLGVVFLLPGLIATCYR